MHCIVQSTQTVHARKQNNCLVHSSSLSVVFLSHILLPIIPSSSLLPSPADELGSTRATYLTSVYLPIFCEHEIVVFLANLSEGTQLVKEMLTDFDTFAYRVHCNGPALRIDELEGVK